MAVNGTAPPVDDVEVLRRYLTQGDPEALRYLIQKHQAMVLAVCRRQFDGREDAEDAAQEVFLSFIANAERIRTNVGAWLYRCAMSTSTSMIRSRRNRVRFELERTRLAGGPNHAGDALWREHLSLLDECLGRLDSTDHRLLWRNCVAGEPQRALAASLGISQQAVAKRIGKALAQLRRGMLARNGAAALVALTALLLKRMASAAIPQGLRTSSITPLASGSAGAAGTLKAGTVAVLVVTATVLTCENAENWPAAAATPPDSTTTMTADPSLPGTRPSLTPRSYPRGWVISGPAGPTGGFADQSMSIAAAAPSPTVSGPRASDRDAVRAEDGPRGPKNPASSKAQAADSPASSAASASTPSGTGLDRGTPSSRTAKAGRPTTDGKEPDDVTLDAPLGDDVAAPAGDASTTPPPPVTDASAGSDATGDREWSAQFGGGSVRRRQIFSVKRLAMKARLTRKAAAPAAGQGRSADTSPRPPRNDPPPPAGSINLAGSGAASPSAAGADAAAGDSSGALDTLAPSNALTVEIGGILPAIQYDQPLIDDHLMPGGNPEVKLLDGFTPQPGGSLKLFSDELSGQFTDLALPPLDAGLNRDTSSLYTDGRLAAAPEPATLALLLPLGLAVMQRRRRRA